METKTLSKNFKTYKFNFNGANIKIYKDNIEKPIVKDDGSFLIVENETTAKIEQLFIKNKVGKIVYEDNIELILPKSSNNEEIIFSSSRGNINLKDLILDRLIIHHGFGDIKLENIDSPLINIDLVRGNVIAEIKESILNYTTLVNGNCEQSTIESMDTNNVPVFLDNKHNLNIDNPSGNIKILFKGKR